MFIACTLTIKAILMRLMLNYECKLIVNSNVLPFGLVFGGINKVLCCLMHASTKFGGNILRTKSNNVSSVVIFLRFPGAILDPPVLLSPGRMSVTRIIPRTTARNVVVK